MELTQDQAFIVDSPLSTSLFVHGPAGSGKSTAGIYRLQRWIEEGIEGRKVLLLFPQRNLGARYQEYIAGLSFQGYSLPASATYGGLARRLISLFWPTLLTSYPHFNPDFPPTFLTLESSLFFLSNLVEPLMLEQGYFSTVAIQRNRLYSQILDNLNKSAIHGFPHTEIAQRLISAWIGEEIQEAVFMQAQEAANQFRELCYQKNLLDYSLQIELFTKSFREIPLVKSYLLNQYEYLLYDNAEEDIPVSHAFVDALLPEMKSSLVIFDDDAGYRNFLGASPASGYALHEQCQVVRPFSHMLTSSPALTDFNEQLARSIHAKSSPVTKPVLSGSTYSLHFQRYYPEMAAEVAQEIRSLLDSGIEPGNIAVLSPFLNDSLKFLLATELDSLGIPFISHRPSRALRDEPVTNCLLTLAAIAHPDWLIHPSLYDLATAFLQLFSDIDLTRSYLLAEGALTSVSESPTGLSPFQDFKPSLQERISFLHGKRYQDVLDWLSAYQGAPPVALDHFLSKLFGELLTRPEFGFHDDLVKGRVTSQIIESFAKFRRSAADVLKWDPVTAGKEYYRMVKTGVLANQYLRAWTEIPPGNVLLAPAYTFLLNNKAVDYQFWLEVGSRGWYERIYQPLTNPHVLSQAWRMGDRWTDEQETALNIHTLSCLTTGLIRRCRVGIKAFLTETDELGFEQKGLLLESLSRLKLSPQASHPIEGLN